MTESRKVSFKNGYETTLEFKLVKKSHQYGNGMAVHMHDLCSSHNDERIYVRYDTFLKYDGSNFSDWVDKYIEDRFYKEVKMNLSNANRELLRCCVYGAAIGDALGVPYEFSRRGTFKCTGMKGYGTWGKPAGTYSDDTGMMLAMLDSIAETCSIDHWNMIAKFRQWIKGEYMPDYDCFDCGNTCRKAIVVGRGLDGGMDNGNGSLMRIAPLAALHCTDEEIKSASSVTHANYLSKNACVAFVRMVEYAWDSVLKAKEEIAKTNVKDAVEDDISSGGYVMDTLKAALWCFYNTDNYKDCVLSAVNLGRDTDTTACVAGALACAAYGFDSIPSEWFTTLRNKREIERILRKF